MNQESENAQVRAHERAATKTEAVQDQMKVELSKGINLLRDRVAVRPELGPMSLKDFFDQGIASLFNIAFYTYLKHEGFITSENEAEMEAKTVEEFIAALQEAKEMLGATYEVKGNGDDEVVAGVAKEEQGKTAAVLAETTSEELSPENVEFLAGFRQQFHSLADVFQETGHAEGMPTFDEWVEAMKKKGNRTLDALRLSKEAFVLIMKFVLGEDDKVKSYKPGLRPAGMASPWLPSFGNAVCGEDIPRKA